MAFLNILLLKGKLRVWLGLLSRIDDFKVANQSY